MTYRPTPHRAEDDCFLFLASNTLNRSDEGSSYAVVWLFAFESMAGRMII